MDEGTIYNPQGAPDKTEPNMPVQPAAPQQAPLPVPPAPNQFVPPLVPNTPPPVAPPAPEKKSTFSGKIIKILLGIFAVFLVILVVIFLISKLTHKSSPQSGPVTLTYWGLVDKNKVDSQIKGFESENPKIKINYIKEDPADYVEKLKVRIPNGNGPDVFMINNSWIPALSDYLLPLPQSVIDQKKFDENFYPVAKTDLIKKGAVYAVPLSVDNLALFINPSLLPTGSENSSPSTWPEFVELAQKATKRDDQGKITVAGAGIGTFDNVVHAQYLLALLFAQNGVDFSKIIDYQDRISQALTFYTDFTQVENSVWDENQDSSLLSFSEGKLAMYFGFTQDLDTIKAQNPGLSFKVSPIPQLTPDDPKNVANYLAQGVSTGTSHQKEALLFMDYVLKHPENLGHLSANKNSPAPTDPNFGVFQTQASSAVSSPYAADASEKSFNAKLIDSLRQSINSILGGGNTDEAAGQIVQDYNSAISSLQNSSTGK